MDVERTARGELARRKKTGMPLHQVLGRRTPAFASRLVRATASSQVVEGVEMDPAGLRVRNGVLMVCDVQEKFRSVIHGFDSMVTSIDTLMSGCGVLDVPIIVSEQYPKGLGKTVPELIKTAEAHQARFIEKTKFSMLIPEVKELLTEKVSGDRLHVFLCGLETHVCVFQTALDLLENGVDVHLVVDAISSQREADRAVALSTLGNMGCTVTTVESILFEILGDAKHEKFKEVSGMIRRRSFENGQLSL